MYSKKSWLFIPSNNSKMVKKAKELKADVLIFDLEDAVPVAKKKEAYQILHDNLDACLLQEKKVIVRINSVNSSFIKDDIDFITNQNISTIMVPKIETQTDIINLVDLLKQKEVNQQTILIPLIETAKGVENLLTIAKSSHRIERVAFGALDYINDIKGFVSKQGYELSYARGKIINSSRAANILEPIDTVFKDIEDLEGLHNETKIVKNMGFKGKLAVHPKQLDIINKIFSPTFEEVEKAKKIVQAFNCNEAQGTGSLKVDGEMIDMPVVEQAKKIIDEFENTK